KVLDGGADIVTRARWNAACWLNTAGGRLDLIALLKKSRGKGLIDQPIVIETTAKNALTLRLVAIRKPKQARDLSIEKIKRKARDKCRAVRPQTLVAAEWVIIITSLDRAEFPLPAIGALYRLRWRIEIAFKHLKSVVGLASPPGGDPRSAKAHILCNLLL